ncbi:nuclear speckle splicing regulatory protein 1 [Aplochiton taeniatus]
MAAPGGKQYGLILSQKKSASKTSTLLRPSIFGDDSDEETSVGESLQKEAVKKRMMKQTRLEMHKALEQDSSVYDYDGVYEDIQKERLESSKKTLGGVDKKPKYINQLLKAVEERKKEQERRDERKIQKEREQEGEQFADKEAYVTSAYRQKLKERQEELEREKREAEMEAALDVKKQRDMSGFYRHLLNQTVGEEAIPDRSAPREQSTKESKQPEESPPTPPSRDHAPSSHSDSEGEGLNLKPGFSKPAAGSAHSKRQYRQRSPSSGSADEKEKDKERSEESKQKKGDEEEKKGDEEEKGEKEVKVDKFAKRSSEETVTSARDRYLARQITRSSKTYIEKEED